MSKQSILMGGVEELEQIKEKLINRAELHKEIVDKTLMSEQAERDIQSEENYVTTTIESMTIQQRTAIETEYDNQINENTNRLRDTEARREADRKKAVAARILKETTDIKNENKELHEKIRKSFKENNVPSFCDSSLYYALFQASDKRDFIIFAIATVLMLAIIPNAVCLFLPLFWVWKVLIYVGIVVIFVLIYCLIYKKTKAGKLEVFKEMKPDRDLIIANKKRIPATKKFIKQDSDESTYNLEGYDIEIKEFNSIIGKLRDERKAKLKEFDTITAKAIKEEITGASAQKIADLKAQKTSLGKKIKSLDGKEKTVNKYIETNYVPLMGEQFMEVDEIERMISIIQDGRASVIAEAMGIVKGES